MSVPSEGGLRIVLLGYVVGFPLGGMTWHSIHYAVGLRALGHDVWVLEDSGDYDSAYDPSTGEVGDHAYGLRYAAAVFDRIGLGDRWAYHAAPAGRWHGPAAERAVSVCERADLVINLSGIHPLRPWLREIPARLFVDTDPAFTQIRHLTDPGARAHAEAHTTFASFGENLATGRAAIPDDGFPWVATRQPIVLDAWPASPPPPNAPFSTVMQWDSYEAREHGGVRYGMKSASFPPYADLPARAGGGFEIAVGRMTPDRREELRRAGWVVSDGQEATSDPWVYQRRIEVSLGEFSVAKQGYVVSRSGWFSERSACYLAAGRPVVVQDTGFSEILPTGDGLLSFSTVDEALTAVETVRGDPVGHGRAARELAEASFDARAVLTGLVATAMRGARVS